MRERAATILPFAIAVVLPPAGFILGFFEYAQQDRDLGVRLMVVAVLAAVVWAFLLLR